MSRIRLTRSSKLIPAASAAWGRRLVSVRPGIEFASSTQGPSAARIRWAPGEALAAERLAGGERGVGDRGALGGGEVGGADEVGATDLVAGFEVVGVAF